MDSRIDTSLDQFRYKGDRPLKDSDTITVLYQKSDGSLASVRIDKSDIYADESWVVYSKDGKMLISFMKYDDNYVEHEELVNYKVKEILIESNSPNIVIKCDDYEEMEYYGKIDLIAYKKNNSELKLEIICDSAFCFCKNLRELIIPDSVRAIGKGAFWGCESLASIILSGQLEVISEKAFWGCRSLRSIKMPESLKRIEDKAFEFCGSLSFIFFAQNVEYVAPTAFNTGKVYPSQIIVPNLTDSYYSELLKDTKVIVKTVDEFNNEQVGVSQIEEKRKSDNKIGFIVFIIINVLVVGGLLLLLSMFRSCV